MTESRNPKKVTSKVKSWIVDSISSGMSFTHKLHQSFLRVFGVVRESESSTTKLEKAFASKIDQIVRKGKSPTILFDTEEIWEAFHACVQAFPNEKVTLEVKDKKGRAFSQEFNVFQSLHQYALAIRADEQMIQEHKRVLSNGTGFINRARLQRQIADAKSRNGERLSLFQRIVFTEADAIEKGIRRRLLSIQGKPITLEQLVYLVRQRALKAKEREAAQYQMPIPEDPPSKSSPKSAPPPPPKVAKKNDAKSVHQTEPVVKRKHVVQEVVDWEEIRDGDLSDEKPLDNSYDLDF